MHVTIRHQYANHSILILKIYTKILLNFWLSLINYRLLTSYSTIRYSVTITTTTQILILNFWKIANHHICTHSSLAMPSIPNFENLWTWYLLTLAHYNKTIVTTQKFVLYGNGKIFTSFLFVIALDTCSSTFRIFYVIL